MMDDDIKEGFLCPICFKDLKSPTNLSSHFEEFHEEDKAILQQVRNVFGKAKRKILNIQTDDTDGSDLTSVDSHSTSVSRGTPWTGGIDVALWDTQSLGAMKTHTNVFRKKRKETIEGNVVEINKLIIRLDKLVKSGIYMSDSSLPGAVKTRKNTERSIVPWQNDKEVKYCSQCNKKFTVTFRRHHCRLCGIVICQNCIGMMDMNIICSLLSLDKHEAVAYVRVDNDSESDNGLRACISCQELLERQNKLYQDENANETLIHLYEKMKNSMREADYIQPKFLKMAESVNAGETEFGLESTAETRFKLLKQYESVEALSKRIQQLGLGSDKEPGPKMLKLQRSVRMFASNYLADNMFTMPSLPTQDKYNEMLKERDRERERIKKEKLIAANTKKQSANSQSSSRPSTPPPVTTHQQGLKTQEQPDEPVSSDTMEPELNEIDDHTSSRSYTIGHGSGQPVANNTGSGSSFFRTSTNVFNALKKEIRPFQTFSVSKPKNTSWGPVQVSTEDSGQDPILQQIRNIESYIRQASEDQRWEEVHMFKQNLKELKLVYEEQNGIADEFDEIDRMLTR